MRNKIFFFLAFLIALYTIGQETPIGQYTRLLDYDYEGIISSDSVHQLNGNYNIVPTRENRHYRIVRYQIGIPNGEWITLSYTFDRSLSLSLVENYKRGKKEGYYFKLETHNNYTEGSYKEDNKHGVWIENNELENIKVTYCKGVKSGKYFYKDKISLSSTEGQYKNGEKDGEWIIIDKNIASKTIEIYNDGKLVAKKEN